MSGEGQPVDFGGMSDEDFLNMDPSQFVDTAVEAPVVEQGNNETEVQQQVEEPVVPVVEEADEVITAKGPEGEDLGGQPSGEEPAPGGDKPNEKEEPKPEGTKEGEEDEGVVAPSGSEAEVNPAAEATESVNLQEFHDKIMAPFKANGRTFTPKSAEEVIQLAQMGANYTRKMQDIQPHRKVLTMLQNNNLLDEGKLDLLIAVNNKDPEAIKKLLKDSGIDPLDLDTTSEPTYVEGSHLVSDEEVGFNNAVEELVSTATGKDTLNHIRDTWDQASKDALWKEPALMAAIDTQRSNGIYDLISDEVNRLRLLGTIPASKSFIEAYQVVGDHLAKTGGFDSLIQKEAPKTPVVPPAGQPAVPVATRVAAPKAPVENDERARAAASTQGTAKPAKVLVNPLLMSDEDFMKLPNINTM